MNAEERFEELANLRKLKEKYERAGRVFQAQRMLVRMRKIEAQQREDEDGSES